MRFSHSQVCQRMFEPGTVNYQLVEDAWKNDYLDILHMQRLILNISIPGEVVLSQRIQKIRGENHIILDFS